MTPDASRPRRHPSRRAGTRTPACVASVLLCLGFESSAASWRTSQAGREIPQPAPVPGPITGGPSTGGSVPGGGSRVDEVMAQERRLLAAAAATGPDSLEAARILSTTAHRLWGLEEYVAAKPLAERALLIRLKRLDGEHPDVAASLYQVADLRRATGDYAGAMSLYRKALVVWEKTRGAESPEVATALHYLGVVSLTTGDRARAKGLLERALEIREKSLGPGHDLVATTLDALAELSLQAGDRAAAGPLLERAQTIWEQALGPGHPFVARCLTSRASLLEQGGDPAGARRLLEQALAIRTRAFGPDHYLVARSLVDLANLMARTGDGSSAVAGDETSAEALYHRALGIQRRSLGPMHPEVASTLAALARLERAMGRIGPALDDTLRAESIAREFFGRSARDLTDGEALQYEAIRTSGLDVALSILAAPDTAQVVTDTDVRRITEEVIRSRAIVLDQRARGHRDPARALPEAGAGLREVLDALPATSALVSYVRYRDAGPRVSDSAGAFLALVMKPGNAPPMVVPLGAAGRVESAIADWRAEVSVDPRSRPPGAGERAYRDAGERLRRAIWDPLQPALDGISQVLVVPDGAIDQVNLATLPTAPGRYLVETGPGIHYLTAERDLVVFARVARATGTGVLVVGDPDFEAGIEAPGISPADGPAPPPDAASGTAPGAAPLCAEFETLDFDPLPGARAEAEAVESFWSPGAPVFRLTGARAGEAEFKKNAPGRRILHLATHAYLLSDRCGPVRGLPVPAAETTFIGDRPLLRSGLALAGANRHGDGRASAGGEDGILTAEEIAALDLSGVEWAVLSGCDTGAGKVLTGEGVVGLRRAFELAGARTVIMSLWAVDDGAALVLMKNLYGNRLAGLSTAEAVRRAALQIIDAQRVRGRTTHPYFWGGFVAAGDWR